MNTKEQNQKTTSEQNYKAIEALVVDNTDLERLEILLNQFNMFEAMGAVWQKSIHSNLLAFLLNPQQNHKLEDAFLRRLLQKAVMSAYEVPVPVSPIDLDVWDLKHMLVLRESQRIDILLLDERHRLAIIIVNQLSGRTLANQLGRHWDVVNQSHPGWDIIGLYLTPDGEPPPDERYLSVDYAVICTILEGLAQARVAELDKDVSTMIAHYTEMLRRHIVGESEITRLCRRIYGKHQRAFDLIYEHRLSRQKVVRNIIKLLIEQRQGLLLDHSQERYIGFTVQEWQVPALMESKDGSYPSQVLIFQFDTWFDTLPLYLYVGPGTGLVRQRLIEVARANQPPFSVDATQPPDEAWNKIFERTFLTSEFYEEANADELAEKILQNWTEFLKNELPQMQAILEKQDWMKKSTRGS